MVVYLDVLLFLNLFINYFLLLSVSAWNKIRPPFIRMFLGSAAGAAVSLVIFLPKMPFFVDIGLKLVCCLLTVLITFSFRSLSRFLRLTVSFFAVSVAFAGIMLAVWFTLRPDGLVVQNSAVYFNISPGLLVVSTIVSYFIVRLVLFFKQRQNPACIEYQLTIWGNGQTAKCRAVLDTGHSLSDLFTGDPVIVTEYAVVESLISAEKRPVFAANTLDNMASANQGVHLIPYTAVSGEGFLPSFRPDSIELEQNGKRIKTNRVLIAVSQVPLSPEYPALISADLADEL